MSDYQAHEFSALTISNGALREAPPLRLRNTFFGRLFGVNAAYSVSIPKPRSREQREEIEELALRLLHDQPVIGSSSSGLKSGRIWIGTDPAVQKAVHGYFVSAQEALSYSGLLFNENLRTEILAPEEWAIGCPGKGDGQGWIDAAYLESLGFRHRQVQVRALGRGALVKGTCIPVYGLQALTGKALLLHDTQLKGRRKEHGGTLLLGIREVAEPRQIKGSWTWLQFLSDKRLRDVFQRHASESFQRLGRVFRSNDDALEFLAALPRASGEVDGLAEEQDQESARDLLVAMLSSGLPVTHPWAHQRLLKLVRRAYMDVAHAAGPVPLHSGMACCVDENRPRHTVTANWLPEGTYALLRYPVRDQWSVRLVRNVHQGGVPYGSIDVHPELMQSLDGDIDGDWIALSDDPDVIAGVGEFHSSCTSERLDIPARTRRMDSLGDTLEVFVRNLNSDGIGSATFAIAAATHQGLEGLVPELSLRLQCSTMSLKWDIDKPELSFDGELRLPKWLEWREDAFRGQALSHVENVGMGRCWNAAQLHYEHVAIPQRETPWEHLDLLAPPDLPMDAWLEIELRRRDFAAVCTRDGVDGRMDEINKLRSWGAQHDADYARAAWFVSHWAARDEASAAFVFHAFGPQLVGLLQEATGYRPPTAQSFQLEEPVRVLGASFEWPLEVTRRAPDTVRGAPGIDLRAIAYGRYRNGEPHGEVELVGGRLDKGGWGWSGPGLTIAPHGTKTTVPWLRKQIREALVEWANGRRLKGTSVRPAGPPTVDEPLRTQRFFSKALGIYQEARLYECRNCGPWPHLMNWLNRGEIEPVRCQKGCRNRSVRAFGGDGAWMCSCCGAQAGASATAEVSVWISDSEVLRCLVYLTGTWVVQAWNGVASTSREKVA